MNKLGGCVRTDLSAGSMICVLAVACYGYMQTSRGDNNNFVSKNNRLKMLLRVKICFEGSYVFAIDAKLLFTARHVSSYRKRVQ